MAITGMLLLLLLSLIGIAICGKNECSSMQCKCCTKVSTFKTTDTFRNKPNGTLTTGKTNLNMQCARVSWAVTIPETSKKIRLKFDDFELAKEDSLRIYDGLDKNDQIITEFNSIHRPHEIITSGPNLLVTLKTTCEIAFRSFRASFKTADCGGLIIASQVSSKPLSSPKPERGRLYPPNSDCLWVAVPLQIKQASLNCFTVEIKKFETDSDDILKIYSSLDQNQAKLHQLRGKLPEKSMHFQQTPGLVFHFLSDSRLHLKGFKIKTQLSRDCSSICQKPDSIQNGNIHVSKFTQQVKYRCCPGYERVGSARKTCVDGSWTPKRKTTCKKILTCLEPLAPQNGKIVKKTNRILHQVGTTLKVKCNKSFYQNGISGLEVIKATCSCTGDWKYDVGIPHCKQIYCSQPPPGAPQPGGSVTVTKPYFSEGYPMNTLATYSCPNGSNFRGIPYRICNAKGRWSTRLESSLLYGLFRFRSPVQWSNNSQNAAVYHMCTNYAECGRVVARKCSPRRGRRTVGGCRSQQGAWPWVVAIYTRRNGRTAFLCGGSIIDRKAIMTAAGCIRDGGHIKANELLVVVGDTRRFVNDRTEKTYTVCKARMHNDFPQVPWHPTVAVFDNDIAILHLCCLLEYGPFVRPICLPQTGDEKFYHSGEGIVAGWGSTKSVTQRQIGSVQIPSELNQVELLIADFDTCFNVMDDKNTEAKEVTGNMFCAGSGLGKKDSCTGDTGSPFFSKRDSEDDDRYVVTGIVSWGIGCAQENTYGVYTKVAEYVGWIKERVDESTINEHDVCTPEIELV